MTLVINPCHRPPASATRISGQSAHRPHVNERETTRDLRGISPGHDTVVGPHEIGMRKESGIDQRDRRAVSRESWVGAQSQGRGNRPECRLGVEWPDGSARGLRARPARGSAASSSTRLLNTGRAGAVGASPARDEPRASRAMTRASSHAASAIAGGVDERPQSAHDEHALPCHDPQAMAVRIASERSRSEAT